jgi:hypothetical protein
MTKGQKVKLKSEMMANRASISAILKMSVHLALVPILTVIGISLEYGVFARIWLNNIAHIKMILQRHSSVKMVRFKQAFKPLTRGGAKGIGRCLLGKNWKVSPRFMVKSMIVTRDCHAGIHHQKRNDFQVF